jgi:hypothetical protein
MSAIMVSTSSGLIVVTVVSVSSADFSTANQSRSVTM